MFTGLIEDVGLIRDIRTRGNYQVLTIETCLADGTMAIGDSLSCDGACLTVTVVEDGRLVVEASQETASRTILDYYKAGQNLNLERALKVGQRLGGHFVLGHVDCTGKIDLIKPVGDSVEVAVSYDTDFDPLVIEKGSIAVNGMSLTVNSVRSGWLSVNLIPHTVGQTTIASFAKGDPVSYTHLTLPTN